LGIVAISSVVMAKKNMDNEPRSIMLSAKSEKYLVAQGLV
jgi:hypothetical protein